MNIHQRTLLATTALIAATTQAHAQDAIVPDDFTTIQQAVLGAMDTDGDGTVEILVRAGTYNENVLIQRSDLELTGEAAATTTVQGSGALDAIRVQDADRVAIQQLTITNNGFRAAVELQRTADCVVQGNVLAASADGLEVNRSSGASIVDNEAHGNTSSGIKLSRSSSNVLMTNDCHDNGSHGIDVGGSDLNIVQANTLTANGSNGLRLRGAANNQVIANIATANVDNGIRMRRSADNNLLSMNTCSGNLSNGLRMRGTAFNVITLNSFTNNVDFGIRRRNWLADDFHGGQAGVQEPLDGDNDLSGNGKGPLRED